MQRHDFGTQPVVFTQLAVEEGARQPRLGLDAGRGQQIGITEFVRVASEVAGFHPAFVDQGAQGVVEVAQGDAGIVGKLALVGLQGLGEAAALLMLRPLVALGAAFSACE